MTAQTKMQAYGGELLRTFTSFGLNGSRRRASKIISNNSDAKSGVILPDGFSGEVYRDLHKDLANFSVDEAVAHYVNHGRAEGRRYRPGQVNGFDPAHFREVNPGFAFASDESCEAAWVQGGGERGEPGSQASHLVWLDLDLPSYPDAFPWRFYATLYPREAIHRWAALAHFLQTGFEAQAASLPYGRDGSRFLAAVGRNFYRAKSPRAIQAFELARARGRLSGEDQLRLAEAYERAGLTQSAANEYQELASLGFSDPTAIRGLIRTAIPLGRATSVFQVIRSQPAFGGVSAWTMAGEAAEAVFAFQAQSARSAYAEDRRGDGDAIITDAAMLLDGLLSPLVPGPGKAKQRREILIVSEDGVPPIGRSRLDVRHQALVDLGFTVREFPLSQIAAFEAALAGASAAMLYRMPAWPSVLRALLVAKRCRVPTFYEAVELCFDALHSPPPLASFDDLIAPRRYHDLIFGTALYRQAALRCDFGIVPNAALGAHLEPLVRRRKALVVQECRERVTPRPACSTDGLRLLLQSSEAFVLRSGAGAGAAILRILETCPTVSLTTAGWVRLDQGFDHLAARIRQAGPAADIRDLMAGTDINLVVSRSAPADAFLPEIGWLEAARWAVPTIADANAAHRAAIEDQAVLASDEASWHAALRRLIDKPAERDRIASAALAAFQAHYTVQSVSRSTAQLLRAARVAHRGSKS